MNIIIKLASATYIASLCLGTSAQAAVLDLSGHPKGDTGLSSIDIGDATITTSSGSGTIDFFPNAFQYGGFCALSYDTCETDWTLSFDFVVTNLTFKTDGWDDYDYGELQYFNGSTLLGSVFIDGNKTFDFGNALITTLNYIDSSVGQGFSFGDFHYDQASVVPVPAAIWLFGSGLIGLAGFARRKTQG